MELILLRFLILNNHPLWQVMKNINGYNKSFAYVKWIQIRSLLLIWFKQNAMQHKQKSTGLNNNLKKIDCINPGLSIFWMLELIIFQEILNEAKNWSNRNDGLSVVLEGSLKIIRILRYYLLKRVGNIIKGGIVRKKHFKID